MRIGLDHSNGNVIRGYRDGAVVINQATVEHSVILTPDQLLDWPPTRFEQLTVAHLAAVAELQPELVLLGTGSQQRFPAAALLAPLIGQRIGVESMTTAAACRTYNIIMAEGRRVAAALIVA